jgi:hypothetical protein
MKEQQELRNKNKDENEIYILHRLKDSSMKLTQDQLYALVECHLGQDKVISMQLEAAEINRQRVDSEFTRSLIYRTTTAVPPSFKLICTSKS